MSTLHVSLALINAERTVQFSSSRFAELLSIPHARGVPGALFASVVEATQRQGK